MLTWPRIQDSFLRSNVFPRWVQPKTQLLCAKGVLTCPGPEHHEFCSGRRVFLNLAQSWPICSTLSFSHTLVLNVQLQKAADFEAYSPCPRWIAGLPWRFSLSHLPSLLTTLGIMRPTDVLSNKSRCCQGLNSANWRAGNCFASSLGLRSYPGMWRHLLWWASIWP